MNRLYNLDYLRGLAAFGIMIFHYLSWTLGSPISDTSRIMGRIGIYGVSIFYVLSGLTLFYVYFNKMIPSKTDVLDFIRKRFFRIFPLLWLATFAGIIISVPIPDFMDLFLNITGLFGLFKWEGYIAPGAWSIGNELVFYIFFPFFILFTKKSKTTIALIAIIIFGIYLYFAFAILDPNIGLKEQWKNYVNPMNQVFLFLGGFFIGYFFQNIKIKRPVNILIMASGVALFIFYPVEGTLVQIVTGVNRIVFTISCFAICFSFYKLDIKLPYVMNKPLTLLGEASYSVYLLHGLVYLVVGSIFSYSATHYIHFSETVKLIVCVITTLMLSYLVYENFEKYFMKMSRKKIIQYN